MRKQVANTAPSFRRWSRTKNKNLQRFFDSCLALRVHQAKIFCAKNIDTKRVGFEVGRAEAYCNDKGHISGRIQIVHGLHYFSTIMMHHFRYHFYLCS